MWRKMEYYNSSNGSLFMTGIPYLTKIPFSIFVFPQYHFEDGSKASKAMPPIIIDVVSSNNGAQAQHMLK